MSASRCASKLAGCGTRSRRAIKDSNSVPFFSRSRWGFREPCALDSSEWSTCAVTSTLRVAYLVQIPLLPGELSAAARCPADLLRSSPQGPRRFQPLSVSHPALRTNEQTSKLLRRQALWQIIGAATLFPSSGGCPPSAEDQFSDTIDSFVVPNACEQCRSSIAHLVRVALHDSQRGPDILGQISLAKCASNLSISLATRAALQTCANLTLLITRRSDCAR